MASLIQIKKGNKLKHRLIHSPTLNTVFMVEKVLKDAQELVTVAELKRRLPRKIMHQTLIQIIDYLQINGKIIIGTKGVLWVFTSRKEIEELISKGRTV